jgi:hypothetical protein
MKLLGIRHDRSDAVCNQILGQNGDAARATLEARVQLADERLGELNADHLGEVLFERRQLFKHHCALHQSGSPFLAEAFRLDNFARFSQ